jgi:hypothetical protein
LGDTFTWLTHVQIKAHIDDCKPIELVLISLPEKPAHRHQPHITSQSCAGYGRAFTRLPNLPVGK